MTPSPLKYLHSVLSLFPPAHHYRKHVELLRSERFQPYLVVAFTLWLVGGVEIIQKSGGQGLDPRFWMLVAVLITFYSGVRVFRLRPRQRTIAIRKKQTRADEIVNRIHSSGFAVYQDPSQTNQDGYVLVGPPGIYALKVKERSVFGSRTIEFRRDDELVLGGRIADSRPLKQAQAAAQKIREGLKRVLNKGFAVQPLVVFLNDWRINRPQSEPRVPVVSEDELPQYLNGQERVLSESEMAEISTYLDRAAFAAAC